MTDAALVLGYYDPDDFAGGRLRLDPEAAAAALKANVAEPLGVDLLTAAYTIWSTVCVNMTEAIREITIGQGVDPHEYEMVAGGGAAGAHIVPIAAALGVRRLLIPRLAGVLSAFGGGVADLVREFHQALLTSTDNFAYEAVNATLGNLGSMAAEFFDTLSVPPEHRTVQYSVEARYPFQERELSVPLRHPTVDSREDVERILSDFHAIHERMRGSREPGQIAELSLWKARAIGANGQSTEHKRTPPKAARPLRSPRSRRAFFADLGGLVETPVLRGCDLFPGERVPGPAIIEEPTTVIVLFPATTARASGHGSFLIELEAE